MAVYLYPLWIMMDLESSLPGEKKAWLKDQTQRRGQPNMNDSGGKFMGNVWHNILFPPQGWFLSCLCILWPEPVKLLSLQYAPNNKGRIILMNRVFSCSQDRQKRHVSSLSDVSYCKWRILSQLPGPAVEPRVRSRLRRPRRPDHLAFGPSLFLPPL